MILKVLSRNQRHPHKNNRVKNTCIDFNTWVEDHPHIEHTSHSVIRDEL